jgi:tRNA-splicing ligase RtcB
MLDLARTQLGTVGSGNHYVDIFADEKDRIWVGVHFGSRGFGHKTASGFLALAKGKNFEDKAPEGEMDSPPVLLGIETEIGQDYIEAMHLAGEFAYAGRDVVCAKVVEIMGAKVFQSIHNHHNFAWKEKHFGDEFWVVRKGCTPAFSGQFGFVGATMGSDSVILKGVDSEASKEGLYSTVHGAGRVMSRTQAAGKQKWIKGRPTRVSKGLIDWDQVQTDLAAQHIELRGGGADEAPGVYKKLDEVLGYHAGTIEVLHRLRPLGVAMAGGDVFDPYKD